MSKHNATIVIAITSIKIPKATNIAPRELRALWAPSWVR